MATMESIADQLYPLVYDAEFPFLFCILCKYAVLVPSITDHLKGVHDKDVPTSQRKVVREAASQLHGMYERKEAMDQFCLPSPGDRPIAYIQAPVNNGIQCNECGWITTSKHRKRTHCQKTHQGRSGLQWRTNVTCQRLFAKGPHSVWFEVGREENALNSNLTAWLQRDNNPRMYARRYYVALLY